MICGYATSKSYSLIPGEIAKGFDVAIKTQRTVCRMDVIFEDKAGNVYN